MRKYIIVTLLLLATVPAMAQMSSSIPLSEQGKLTYAFQLGRLTMTTPEIKLVRILVLDALKTGNCRTIIDGVPYPVVEFRLSRLLRKGDVLTSRQVKNTNDIPADVFTSLDLDNIRPGDKLMFEDMKVKTASGLARTVNSVTIVVAK